MANELGQESVTFTYYLILTELAEGRVGEKQRILSAEPPFEPM